MPFINHLSFEAQVLFLLLFVAVFYFGFLRSGLSLAPWVPTKKTDLERVANLTQLRSGERFLEAGCGNARVAIYIAKRFPDCTVVGMELSHIMFLWGWLRAKFSGLKNLSVRYGDVLTTNFDEYQVIYSYGLPKTINQKLLPKIQAELPPGGRFISYAFKIDEAEHVTIHRDEAGSNIYVYKKPCLDNTSLNG